MPTPDELLHLDDLLTDEERGWRDRAREFARTRILPTIDDDFEAKHFRAGLVAELGAAGFLGMHLEGYGAAGAGAVSYGVACLEFEAVDSGWRTFLSVQGSLAMTAISLFGSEEQKQRWLPAMAAGGAVGCFALTEAASGSDPAGMATTAVRDGDGWVLSGHKRWIGLASIADIAVVWARTDDGVRGFLVETGLPGFTATPIDTKLSMRASIQCDVVLAGVRVPADAVLPGSTGLGSAFSCLNKARYGISWGAMGAAEFCFHAAREYTGSRMLFGRPLSARGDFAGGLALPLMAEKKEAHILLWLGEGAYDLRYQRTLRALVRLMHRAGVDFAVLGTEERDCGDTARRLGDEATFQRLALLNVETLSRYRFGRILTADEMRAWVRAAASSMRSFGGPSLMACVMPPVSSTSAMWRRAFSASCAVSHST